MRPASLERLFGIEGGMDSPEYHPGATLTDGASHFIASQGIARVDADADHIPGLNALQVKVF